MAQFLQITLFNYCVQIIINTMDKLEYSRVPIYYSLAYHSMSYSKDDPNQCAREFIQYLSKVGNNVSVQASNYINTQILKLQDERHRRELMQAVNLQLSIDAVEDLFPSLAKSKEISRDQIEQLLKAATSHKI